MDEQLLDQVRHDFSEEGFEALFLKLDLLHDAASTGCLSTVTALPLDQIRGWLEEFIFTARETIRELEDRRRETETRR